MVCGTLTFKGGKDDAYFEELLARIRDIRSSEKVFWKKVLDIYATSTDYDPSSESSQVLRRAIFEAKRPRKRSEQCLGLLQELLPRCPARKFAIYGHGRGMPCPWP